MIATGEFDTALDSKVGSPVDFPIMKEYQSSRKAKKENGIIDVLRTLHSSEKDYTHYSKSYHDHPRLDYFLCLVKIHQKSRLSNSSDHSIISTKVNFSLEKDKLYVTVSLK